MGRYDPGFSTDAPPIQMGATFTLNVSLLSTASTSTPYDLTGYSIRSKMRKTYASTAVIATFTGTILSATGGQLRLSLTSTQTATLAEGYYVYDGEVYTTGGTVYRFIEGRALVTPEVTY